MHTILLFFLINTLYAAEHSYTVNIESHGYYYEPLSQNLNTPCMTLHAKTNNGALFNTYVVQDIKSLKDFVGNVPFYDELERECVDVMVCSNINKQFEKNWEHWYIILDNPTNTLVSFTYTYSDCEKSDPTVNIVIILLISVACIMAAVLFCGFFGIICAFYRHHEQQGKLYEMIT